MTDDERLTEQLAAAFDVDRDPPADRIAALRAEVAARRPEAGGTGTRRRMAGNMAAFAAAAVVVAVLAVAGLMVVRSGSGTIEFEGVMASPDSEFTADVVVEALPIGREIHILSDDLPILATGEYYELWFVGPGDSPENRNRISAGTWHPDASGGSDVRFTAAVDPTLYPTLVITAEPGDGNPLPTGPEVLRADLQL